MSWPYEPHFKRCYWCGADVEEEFYNSDLRACEDCVVADKVEDRANDYD